MFGGSMRPWESLSRRDGGQPGQRGGAGSAGEARRQGWGGAEGQAKLATRRVRLRQRNRKSQGILRVSGSFGLSAAPDLGFVRVVVPLGFVRTSPTPLPPSPQGSMHDENSTPFPRQ